MNAAKLRRHDGRAISAPAGRVPRVLVDLKNTPNGLTLDGKPVRTIDRLPSEGKLRLCLPETDRSDTIPQADIALDIVYEDDDLFVVNKPAGLAVHPSPQNRGKHGRKRSGCAVRRTQRTFCLSCHRQTGQKYLWANRSGKKMHCLPVF